MKISLAPYMPILLDCSSNELAFLNLCLFALPNFVTLYVVGRWDELLMESEEVMSSYETFRLMLELPVVEVSAIKKARYIKVIPDVFIGLSQKNRDAIWQQLYALTGLNDSKRIFAGVNESIDILKILSDHKETAIMHFNPYQDISILDLLKSHMPRLEQLKHSHESKKMGDKIISAFSAFDRNDDEYAQKLLRTAYIEHPGNIDDRTYLYTYDKRNKTFVEFRPGRNNVYHGMDISVEEARKKSPYIVRKYHK